MICRLTLEATIPAADLEDFLTLVTSFDREREGCHFKAMAIADDMTVAEMTKILERVGLPLIFVGNKH